MITECHRVLKDEGSICWQVGNYVDKGSIVPLDVVLYPVFAELGMKMRNRIMWHFEHGLHSSRRLSGRYETINWFTRSDEYYFEVNPIRVPQKYPGKKYFKGPKAGQYSSNPLGKNPGDFWVFPNVKNNHVEKTDHPCQFPVELVERLVLSMTQPDDWVLDPFLGAGSAMVAALRHNRRGAGAELVHNYVKIAYGRVRKAMDGTLRVRPMNTPVYDPKDAGNSLTTAPWLTGHSAKNSNGNGKHALQPTLLEKPRNRYKVGKQMKIVEIYSHLNGQEYLLVHKPKLWPEVQEVIEQIDANACRTKVSKESRMKGQLKYSPIEMNKRFSKLLNAQDWQESRVSYWVTRDVKLIRQTLAKTPDEQKHEIEAAGRNRFLAITRPIL